VRRRLRRVEEWFAGPHVVNVIRAKVGCLNRRSLRIDLKWVVVTEKVRIESLGHISSVYQTTTGESTYEVDSSRTALALPDVPFCAAVRMTMAVFVVRCSEPELVRSVAESGTTDPWSGGKGVVSVSVMRSVRRSTRGTRIHTPAASVRWAWGSPRYRSSAILWPHTI
jgi:hypothetical protein